MPEALKLLRDIRVVDLGVGMSTALVAKYLADAGADVVRIEPKGGDPFYNCYPAYEIWRRGITRNRAAEHDSSLLNALLAAADICIIGGEDHPGLEHCNNAEAISSANSRLVVLDITGYPHGSKSAGRPLNEILAQARSGLCYEQFSTCPILIGFQPASYGAALQGLCALLAAVYAREFSGHGQIARTSLFEGALTWLGLFWGDFEKPAPQCFVNPKDTTPLIFRCADGAYIHLVIGAPGSKYKVYQILGIDDPSVRPGEGDMPDISSGPRNFYGNIDVLAPYIAARKSGDLLEALWSAGLPAELVLAPGACWDSPQAVHNALIAQDADGTRHVANPIIATSSPGKYRAQLHSFRRPLTGIRVIDFGAYLAGPKASAVLADLGADAIKVEPPLGDPNRATFRSFMTANRGKRGMILDLKSAEGMKIAQELSVKADIVCNNFRSGVSARLGIDPKTLHALKPELIILESPAYGSSGPLAKRAGFDMVMQAFCGHEIRAGGKGNDPLYTRSPIVDFAGGMLGAVGMLSALIYRVRTGNGVALDVPLFNAGVFLLSELIQRPNGSFEGSEPINPTRTGFSPGEAMYEAKDGWIAISAQRDTATTGLVRVLGLAGKIPTSAESWGDKESEIIATAVSVRSVAELAAALEEVGVWTEVCKRDAEHEFLNSEGARISTHRTMGRIREIGPLFSLSASNVENKRPIHELGEHTKEILSQLHDAEQALQ